MKTIRFFVVSALFWIGLPICNGQDGVFVCNLDKYVIDSPPNDVLNIVPPTREKNASTVLPLRGTDSTELYNFSVGLNYCFLGGGPSIKYSISKNCVCQTDFMGNYFINYTSLSNGFAIFINEISQNFLFQHKFSEKQGATYYYMIGGGVSGGVSLLRPHLWKIGTYPFFGFEFLLKEKKLSFQIDIRPGYGLLLKSEKARPPRDYSLRSFFALAFYLNPPEQYPYHGYDISINFAVRFCKFK